MDFSCDASTSSSRPTLPPLHTLNLPIPTSRKEFCSDDAYDYKPCYIPQLQNTRNHTRQFSISSSVTSRSPSPIMHDYFVTRSSLSPSPTPSSGTPPVSAHGDAAALKVRLVPCPFESADAYIYVPPSSTSSAAPKVSDTIQGQLHGSQPLLLVGSAARQLRQPSQKFAKGARVHPYRIMRTASAYRPPRRLL